MLTKLKADGAKKSTIDSATIAFKDTDGKIIVCDAKTLDKALRGAKSIGATEFGNTSETFAHAQTKKGYVVCPTISTYHSINDNCFVYAPKEAARQQTTATLTNDTEAKQKATEAVLAALSKAGIEVVRATDEEVKALLSNSHATTLRTPQGTIYGWSVNGKIYLTEAGINPDTPIHEYTHLWAEAMMIKNKKGWDSIKALLKDNPIWNEVVADANYSNIADNEDAVASEVLSRISGKKNAAKMEEEAQRAIDEAKGVFEKARATTILTNLKKALNSLWKWVSKNIFDVKEFSSINEVTDKVLYDLIHSTKLINDKSLIGVHNISEQKLRKVLKQGGFANPSIAVIDTDKQVHNDYGEISLMLPSRKVNKSTGKNVGTYEGDAWTPMYPIIEKQMSSDGSLIMHNDINSVPNEMQSEVRNALNRWLGNGSDTDLSYLYLFQQGKAPKMATVKPKYSNEVYKSLRDIMFGVDSVYNLTKGEVKNLVELYVQTELNGDIDEYNKANERRIAKYKDAIENGRTNSMYYKIAERNLEEVKKYGYPLSSLKTFADDVQRDKTKQGSKNVQKTLNAASQIIKDAGLEEDFRNWVEGLNNRYQTKEVIFNGFTPTGKRRYIPNTLENVSKLMKKQGRQASIGLGVSFSNFAASVMKANGSLANIRKKKSKLTNEHKDIEGFEEKWKEVYFDLAMKLQPNASTFDDYGFTRLQEAALEADPQAFLSKEYGVTLSKEDVRKLQQMVKAIQEERPAMYFETKFERPVTLDEFSKAVVPEDLSDDLQKTLRDNGIEIFTYKRGDAEDRQKATQEAAYSSDDIAFQIINNGNNEADNNSDTLYRTVFGGNSGYVGYSLSKRAAEAKEEGRYPKTEFKKEYHITEKSLGALTRLGFIDNSEWHHTSMYGNKTPFYDWVEDEFAEDYLKHKKEIDALCKGIDPKTKQPLLEKAEKLPYKYEYELPKHTEAEEAINPIKKWRNEQLDEYDKAIGFKGYANSTEEQKSAREIFMQSLRKQMEKKIAEKLAKDFPEYLAAKTALDAYNNYEENLRKVIGERVKEYLDLDKYSQRWREGRDIETPTDVEELIQHATQTARRLNLDNVEVVADGSIFEDKKATAKGFYNKRTGKITIIASNHSDIADIEKTVLHEGVAHYGLRKLFGDNFNAFLDAVIVQSEEYVRRKIAEMAAKHEWSFRTTTEEYLAGMAEDANFEQLKPTTWQRIKRLFGEMMSALGLHHSDVTDNDLRYLLWRSYKNLKNGGKRSIFDMAEDIAMQYRLKVGNYTDKFTDELKAVNERFNKELNNLTEENADKVALGLGKPSKILLAAGVEDKPMKLYGNKVIRKMKKHGFSLEELRDLPRAVADPVAVFNNYQREGNRSILTELMTQQGNFLVSINIGKDSDIDFNIVRSVFGKGNENVVAWINNGLATYINKEKALSFLSHQSAPIAATAANAGQESSSYLHFSERNISEASNKKELSSAAKIIKDFHNPKLNSNILYRSSIDPTENEMLPDAHTRYEKETKEPDKINSVPKTHNFSRRFYKSYVDSMLALKSFTNSVLEATGDKMASHEDTYKAENAMTSKNKTDGEVYNPLFPYMPLYLYM